MPPRPAVRPGLGDQLGVPALVLPVVQDGPASVGGLAPRGRVPPGLAATGPAVRAVARDQLGPDPPRWLQEAVGKGGEASGPSPVDRGKSGTAIHIASDARAMPLAVVVTKAGANDGCQTHKVLAALVVRPPAPEVPTDTPDERGRPTARADGAYGNEPSRDRAGSERFRLYAPGRGEK